MAETDFDRWLSDKSPEIKALAAEFPPSLMLQFPDGAMLYIVGYTDDDEVVVTRVYPWAKEGDYDRAMAAAEIIPAHVLRLPNTRVRVN